MQIPVFLSQVSQANSDLLSEQRHVTTCKETSRWWKLTHPPAGAQRFYWASVTYTQLATHMLLLFNFTFAFKRLLKCP